MTKRPVAIITDSTANIPDDLIARHNIEVIPQILNWAGESYRDGVDISHTAFYDRLPQDSASPSTSQPSVGEFVEFFGEVGKRADLVLLRSARLLDLDRIGVAADPAVRLEYGHIMLAGKVVGCHMVGEHAAEIIQMAAIAIGMGATKADFDRTMALHPTVAEEFVTMPN